MREVPGATLTNSPEIETREPLHAPLVPLRAELRAYATAEKRLGADALAQQLPDEQQVAISRESPGGALIRIQSGAERPEDAYAAVRYRDLWFWIDDRDLRLKRVIMFLMVFASLAETGTAPQTPLITLPAR